MPTVIKVRRARKCAPEHSDFPPFELSSLRREYTARELMIGLDAVLDRSGPKGRSAVGMFEIIEALKDIALEAHDNQGWD